MHVTIRLFARLRDIVGSSELQRELSPPATAQAVWNGLVADAPGLAEYERSISVAVNAEYARMTALLADGDEVAFLPPVSGG